MLFILTKGSAHGLVFVIFSILYDTVYLLAPTLKHAKVKAIDL